MNVIIKNKKSLIALFILLISCNSHNIEINKIKRIDDLKFTSIKYNNKSKCFIYLDDSLIIGYQKSYIYKKDNYYRIIGEFYYNDSSKLHFIVVNNKDKIYLSSDEEWFYFNSTFKIENYNNELLIIENKNKNDRFQKLIFNEIYQLK